ncbi:alpha-hydroxyketone-type quorum-sensing autoinducer synthase [Microbacterium resistens]|nr:alpha-hydroxyketone-type quorum-sensing autoinducer synthase [Microbacterium resistens]
MAVAPPATAVASRALRAELPDFVGARVEGFHRRLALGWGGRHILRGRRPGDGDLLMQSNDYLSIADHAEIIGAQRSSLGTSGLGMMMSAQFLQDEDEPLRRLEALLADAVGFEAGILTQSGFAANVGLLQAIAGPGVPVYIDLLAHASLREGGRSAGAPAISVLHNNLSHLERQLAQNGPGVIVVDAIYSTDGSVSPLRETADLARRHGCVLVVDESHSLGVHGDHGEGLVAALGLTDSVHFLTASLAKAYCARAGFIACTARFREYFGMEALPAIFSSALLPHDLAGIGAAHGVVRDESWRRARLRGTTRRVRSGLRRLGYPINDDDEPIVALEVGTEADTIVVRDVLEANGIFGSVFCAPATATNRALIRLTLNAAMGDDDVDRFLTTLERVRPDLGVDSWSASRRAPRPPTGLTVTVGAGVPI